MAIHNPAPSAAAPSFPAKDVGARSDDFARLRGEELKRTLQDLGERAAQALATAHKSLDTRAEARKHVLDAFKTAAVKRQLDALPELKAHAELLMAAQAKAASEDKKTNDTLQLFGRIASAALPRD